MGAEASVTTTIAHRHRRVPVGLAVSAGVVLALVAVTPVYLVIRASGATASSWDLILRGRTLTLAVNTLGLAAAVTLATAVIGVIAAWIAVRSDIPGRRIWATAFALPLVFPSYVGAFAILAALGPRGLLQGWLEPLGVERLPDIGGFAGAFLALTLFTYPYVYLVAASALRGSTLHGRRPRGRSGATAGSCSAPSRSRCCGPRWPAAHCSLLCTCSTTSARWR
jgi:iron(III) transport system permease protein